MARSVLFVFLTVLTAAMAFTAPQSKGAMVRVAPLSAQKDSSTVHVQAIAKAALLAPVLAAAPAHAFSADYLPAILVPIMTLFLPAMGMALGFILTQKEDL